MSRELAGRNGTPRLFGRETPKTGTPPQMTKNRVHPTPISGDEDGKCVEREGGRQKEREKKEREREREKRERE